MSHTHNTSKKIDNMTILLYCLNLYAVPLLPYLPIELHFNIVLTVNVFIKIDLSSALFVNSTSISALPFKLKAVL